jgi:hypothetical protein
LPVRLSYFTPESGVSNRLNWGVHGKISSSSLNSSGLTRKIETGEDTLLDKEIHFKELACSRVGAGKSAIWCAGWQPFTSGLSSSSWKPAL